MSQTQSTLGDNSIEPWKDENTLRGLYHGDDLNQTEMAEYFSENGHDVTPSTISYWMGKLEIETTHSNHGEDRNEEVEYHDEPCQTCGEDMPANNLICDDCLDDAREGDR